MAWDGRKKRESDKMLQKPAWVQWIVSTLIGLLVMSLGAAVTYGKFLSAIDDIPEVSTTARANRDLNTSQQVTLAEHERRLTAIESQLKALDNIERLANEILRNQQNGK